MIDKKELLAVCVGQVMQKLQSIQLVLEGYKTDLLSESKSTAGDKHETGRAMLQLEMEKLGQQYQTVLQQKQALQRLDNYATEIVQIGSLVLLNQQYYYLATSLGQVACMQHTVFVISFNAPIGKLLLGKKQGDTIVWDGKVLEIKAVV
ncbi:GreA/GreB family elongation factor [Ochrovirga pacifica]|uniref:GreA/GreB family elongation factor n=1 Tax=Ochrovirga pacifica TaxID=1042376 RepID=UPI00025591AF|nr:GreA/GreB family elongation factor [Ochrovirga pacifica]